MDPFEAIDQLYTDLILLIPPVLAQAPALNPIEKWLKYYLDNPAKNTFSIYLAESRSSEDYSSSLPLVRIHLPKELDPQDYARRIFPVIRGLDPEKYGYDTLEIIQIIVYPGEFG